MGFIAYDEKVEARRPVVLVASAFRGQDDFARQRASEFVDLGYIGFAVDIYGWGKHTEDNEEALELMAPFFLDRALLQDRIGAAVSFIQDHPLADKNQIGAIGFCFGGLAVYELLRKGVGVKGAVSFHGVFAVEKEGYKIKTAPISPDASGSLLILHGNDDPRVSDEDFKRVGNEMTRARIDWQIHIYGNTMHAFTDPKANDVEDGKKYSETATRRAFASMQRFFDEVFA